MTIFEHKRIIFAFKNLYIPSSLYLNVIFSEISLRKSFNLHLAKIERVFDNL